MPIDKFTNDYIKFINKHYEINENYFYLYYCGVEFEVLDQKNVQIISYLSNEIDLSRLEQKHDKIIIHSLLYSCVIKYLFYNQSTIDFNKVILVVWGGDIYNNNLEKSVLKTSDKHVEEMKRKILQNIRNFMTFACGDYSYMQQMYSVSGMSYDCLYPSSVNVKYLDGIYHSDKEKRNKTVILLGNSATFTNQHVGALNLLSKYKEENIEIICPLSYGNDKYREMVIEYGNKIFGNKFMPILNYLTPEKYVEIINKADVAIFNNNRQQATANIEIMSYLGKKIYIRNDTSMWEHYVIRDKCAFESVDDITFQSFQQFSENLSRNIDINRSYFKKIWDESYIKKLWDVVFDKGR